jgi:hypothetical protein
MQATKKVTDSKPLFLPFDDQIFGEEKTVVFLTPLVNWHLTRDLL